jgi:hypothetical protein
MRKLWSFLDIVWSEAVQYSFAAEKALISGIDFKDSESLWNSLDSSIKEPIYEWLSSYRFCEHVKPEALISENIWGFVLRKMLLAIEIPCIDHSEQNRLQCFPEFNTSHLEAIGAKFFTDFVFTAGCSGLPIFFAELAISSDQVHKDVKKLAVQMAGALWIDSREWEF